MLREVTADIYHLLHPKMTFFLTSIGRSGVPNVMACAWATPVSEEPPLVTVCVARESYTAELIRQTRAFVINIPSEKLLKALWICGKLSGRDADKFKKAGITYHQSLKVKPPVVEGCMGYLECKLWKTVEAGECYAFFGSVLAAYADDRYFKKGAWTEAAAVPFHLSGGRMVYFKDRQA